MATAFLIVYITRFHAQTDVIAPHLTSLLAVWLVPLGLRLVAWRHVRSERSVRLIDAFLTVIPWLTIVTWYVLVLIGLYSWGHVTTWSLISTYLFQFQYLMRVLDISPLYIPAGIALLAGILVLLTYHHLSRAAWCRKISFKLSAPASVAIPILFFAVSSTHLMKLWIFPSVGTQDPFSLSFFPNHGIQTESHVLGNSPVLNAKEASERSAYRAAPRPPKRNVVLIVGDALRSDHMSLYGYARSTTPHLDSLKNTRSVMIAARVRSSCAESACGLLSLAASRPVHAMPANPITLQETLRQNGYKVNMILSGDHTNFYGLKDAYGVVDSYHDGSQQNTRYMNDDKLILDRVDELPDHDDSQPVMFQFHLMSAHGLGMRHEAANVFTPFINYYRWTKKQRLASREAEIPQAINYYDNGVVQTDLTVQALLERLSIKGYLENALVVITGDHGEMLGEHGMFGHQHSVHEGVLTIPMILIRYGYEGSSFGRSLSSQIDIAPTILKELDLTAPATWMGSPLQITPGPRFIYFQQSHMIGLYDLSSTKHPIKYWRNFLNGQEYVFDINSDPLEKINLIATIDSAKLQSWRSQVIPGSLIGKASTH